MQKQLRYVKDAGRATEGSDLIDRERAIVSSLHAQLALLACYQDVGLSLSLGDATAPEPTQFELVPTAAL